MLIIFGRLDKPDNEASERDGEDIQSTKYFCGIPSCFVLWRVKDENDGGKQKMLEMGITVQSLRSE